MNASIFSPRVLIAWLSATVILFGAALFLLARSKGSDPTGPTTFSRSAIGYAGIADVLHRLGVPIVRSQSETVAQLGPGTLLVIAEPRFDLQQITRQLLAAKSVLLILPKWVGQPSASRPGWIDRAERLPGMVAQQALSLVDRKGTVLQKEWPAPFVTNAVGALPSLPSPVQLLRSDRLRAIVGTGQDMLVGELSEKGRRVWVLADPDVISNHAIAVPANAVFAVALIDALRAAGGSVVFDETVHGFVSAAPNNPLALLFQPPFGLATALGLITLLLLLWAAAGRFGAPQSPAPALHAGKRDLIDNTAKLLEFAHHQPVVVQRYVQVTMRDLGRRLRAPSTLSPEALVGWLDRFGRARGLDTGAILRSADTRASGRDLGTLVRLARDVHRFKGEISDGSGGDPGDDRKRAQRSGQSSRGPG
jgi:hypothetical protein